MSVKACNCTEHGIGTLVKDFITFHIETIPFRTKQKYNHVRCPNCNGARGFTLAHTLDGKEFDKEVNAAKAYLAAQDTQYKYVEGVHMEINRMTDSWYTEEFAAPPTAKQWWQGHIRYCYYDENNAFRHGTKDFLVYCIEDAVTLTAIKQFIRPDSFKAITGIKVLTRPHTQDASKVSCYAPLA